jgi:hypothetical protein
MHKRSLSFKPGGKENDCLIFSDLLDVEKIHQIAKKVSGAHIPKKRKKKKKQASLVSRSFASQKTVSG